MRKTKDEIHEFKKGQILDLDEIYTIQGLAGGDWWVMDDPNDEGGAEEIEITRDIKIVITIYE